MKKYLPVLFLIITIMALIPILANSKVLSFQNTFKQKSDSFQIVSEFKSLPETVSFTDLSDGKSITRSSKAVLHSLVGAVCDKDFTPDEVKALCIACHTQLCTENDNGTLSIDTRDKNVYLTESELKNKFTDDYTALCSYCDSVYSLILTSSGTPAEVNTFPFCSKTDTAKIPVADPYDALFTPDFSGETNGITPKLAKMMSSQGLTYNEILNYCYNV